MEKILKLSALSLIMVIVVSCGSVRDERIMVLSGLLSWVQQDWGNAAASFIGAAEKAHDTTDNELLSYALYGLASTYLAQDEYDSALLRLAEVPANASEEILSGVWYQIGIAAYRKGLYEQARTYFKKALEIQPGALDAKINLELCTRSMVMKESSASAAASGVSESRQKDEQSEILFDMVRRKEQERWKNRQDERSPAVEDY